MTVSPFEVPTVLCFDEYSKGKPLIQINKHFYLTFQARYLAKCTWIDSQRRLKSVFSLLIVNAKMENLKRRQGSIYQQHMCQNLVQCPWPRDFFQRIQTLVKLLVEGCNALKILRALGPTSQPVSVLFFFTAIRIYRSDQSSFSSQQAPSKHSAVGHMTRN